MIDAMTVDEFKKQQPQYAHLEGDQLWDAMTHYALRQQAGEKILRQIKPLWKRYQFRWLFYMPLKGMPFVKHHQSDKRCSTCKKSVGPYMLWLNFSNGTSRAECPHGRHEYVAEPNTNFSYRAYLIWAAIVKTTRFVLDKMHILRRADERRYGTFGDESYFILREEYDQNWQLVKIHFRKRKWWEYVFIEKP